MSSTAQLTSCCLSVLAVSMLSLLTYMLIFMYLFKTTETVNKWLIIYSNKFKTVVTEC